MKDPVWLNVTLSIYDMVIAFLAGLAYSERDDENAKVLRRAIEIVRERRRIEALSD